MYAIPTFPYDPHSVWNRNQLGDLSLSDPSTLAMIGIAAYVGYCMWKKKKIL